MDLGGTADNFSLDPENIGPSDISWRSVSVFKARPLLPATSYLKSWTSYTLTHNYSAFDQGLRSADGAMCSPSPRHILSRIKGSEGV